MHQGARAASGTRAKEFGDRTLFVSASRSALQMESPMLVWMAAGMGISRFRRFVLERVFI